MVLRLSLAGRPVSLLNSDALAEGVLDAVLAARPGAMVFINSVSGDPLAMRTLTRCREAGIPAVAYGNAPELHPFDRAYSDHRAGSRELTRRLLAKGRRRIVPFFKTATSTTFWQRERLDGYAEAMREAGVEPQPPIAYDSDAVDCGNRDYIRVETALATSALLSLRRENALPDAALAAALGLASASAVNAAVAVGEHGL